MSRRGRATVANSLAIVSGVVLSGCLAGMPFAPSDNGEPRCPDHVVYMTFADSTLAVDSIRAPAGCP